MFDAAVQRALDMIQPNTVIGLGTGRASTAFIQALGEKVRKGLKVTGVPTSEVSADLARQGGIALTTLEEAGELACAFDGADEVDPRLDLIKGWGGALVREKIVAASARRFVILVGAEKIVPALGSKGKLPVEVVPFGLPLCRRRLEQLGMKPELRLKNNAVFVTDNGNHILDCGTEPLSNPAQLERNILDIPGVVGCGLFLNMASVVLVQDGDRVVEKSRV